MLRSIVTVKCKVNAKRIWQIALLSVIQTAKAKPAHAKALSSAGAGRTGDGPCPTGGGTYGAGERPVTGRGRWNILLDRSFPCQGLLHFKP
jgi:hypothetical protein